LQSLVAVGVLQSAFYDAEVGRKNAANALVWLNTKLWRRL